MSAVQTLRDEFRNAPQTMRHGLKALKKIATSKEGIPLTMLFAMSTASAGYDLVQNGVNVFNAMQGVGLAILPYCAGKAFEDREL